jgi:hypothetical protein
MPKSPESQPVAGPHINLGDQYPDIVEQFRHEIEEYEKHEGSTFFDMLAARGISLPAPTQLSDEEVKNTLCELIQELARLQIYLRSTDHLSDRQLYETLWSDILREHRPPPLHANDVCVIDLVSGGNAEDIVNWLRYYADDESRAHWQAAFPDEPILPRVKPPFDRDRHLPQPPRPRRKR